MVRCIALICFDHGCLAVQDKPQEYCAYKLCRLVNLLLTAAQGPEICAAGKSLLGSWQQVEKEAAASGPSQRRYMKSTSASLHKQVRALLRLLCPCRQARNVVSQIQTIGIDGSAFPHGLLQARLSHLPNAAAKHKACAAVVQQVKKMTQGA